MEQSVNQREKENEEDPDEGEVKGSSHERRSKEGPDNLNVSDNQRIIIDKTTNLNEDQKGISKEDSNTNINTQKGIRGHEPISSYHSLLSSSSSSMTSSTFRNSDLLPRPPSEIALESSGTSPFVLERSGSSRKRLRAQTIRNRNIQLNNMAIQQSLSRLPRNTTKGNMNSYIMKGNDNSLLGSTSSSERFYDSSQTVSSLSDLLSRDMGETLKNQIQEQATARESDQTLTPGKREGNFIRRSLSTPMGVNNSPLERQTIVFRTNRKGGNDDLPNEEQRIPSKQGNDYEDTATSHLHRHEDQNEGGQYQEPRKEDLEGFLRTNQMGSLDSANLKIGKEGVEKSISSHEKDKILRWKDNDINLELNDIEEKNSSRISSGANFRASEHALPTSLADEIKRQISVPLFPDQTEWTTYGETSIIDEKDSKNYNAGEKGEISQKPWRDTFSFIFGSFSPAILCGWKNDTITGSVTKESENIKCLGWCNEIFYALWIYCKSAFLYIVRELPRKYFRSHTFQYIQTFFIIFSFVTYVVETYYPLNIVLPYLNGTPGLEETFSTEYMRYFWFMVSLEILFSVMFSIDLLMHLLIARSPIRYLLSFGGIVDLLAIIPGYLILTQVSYNGGALPRLLKIARILRVSKTAIADRDTLNTQIMRAILHIVVAILISAGLVNALETEMAEPQYTQKLTWFDALYYTVVTMSTVGYGEIHPVTIWSRMLAVGIIVTAICLIPYEAGRLIDALYRAQVMSHYNIALKEHEKHIVIAGHLDHVHLRRLLQELFHGIYSNYDHPDMMDVKGVILQQGRPDKNMENILNMFGNRLTYVAGSPHFFEDLQRARVEKAKAVFILSQQPSYEGSDNEDRLVLYALALRQYLALHYEKQQKAYFRSRRNKKMKRTMGNFNQNTNQGQVDLKNDESDEEEDEEDYEIDISQFHVKDDNESTSYKYTQFLHKDNNKSRSKIYTPKVLIQLNTTKAKEQVKYATAQIYKQYYHFKNIHNYHQTAVTPEFTSATATHFEQNVNSIGKEEIGKNRRSPNLPPDLLLPSNSGDIPSNTSSPNTPIYGLSSYLSPTRGKSFVQARNQALGYRNSLTSGKEFGVPNLDEGLKKQNDGIIGEIELKDFRTSSLPEIDGEFWSTPRKQKRLRDMQLKFYSPDQHIVCLSELKLALIAYGTVFRGFLALVINLLRSLPSSNTNSVSANLNHWESCYRHGGTHTIYTVDLSIEKYPQLKNWTFSDVMKYLYEHHKLLAIGCQTKSKDDLPSDQGTYGKDIQGNKKSIFHTDRVLINPGKTFQIPKEGACIFFIMATSYKSVRDALQEISALKPSNPMSPRHHYASKSFLNFQKKKNVQSKRHLDFNESFRSKGKDRDKVFMNNGTNQYSIDMNKRQEIGAGNTEERMKRYAKLSRKAFFNERLIERHDKLRQRRMEDYAKLTRIVPVDERPDNNKDNAKRRNSESNFKDDFDYNNLNNTVNSNSSLVIVDINRKPEEASSSSSLQYSPTASSRYKHPSVVNFFPSENQEQPNDLELLPSSSSSRSSHVNDETMSREKGEISETTEEVIINHENEGEEVLSGDSSSCTDSDGSYSTESESGEESELEEEEEEEVEREGKEVESGVTGEENTTNKKKVFNDKKFKVNEEIAFDNKTITEGIRSVVDGFLSEDVWLEMKELASRAKEYLNRIRVIEEENKIRLMEGKDPISHGDPQRQRLINLSLLAMQTLEEYTNVHCFISREAVATARNHILICVCSTGSSYNFLSHILIPLGRCTNSPIVIMGNNSNFFGPVLSGLNKRAVTDTTVRATGIYFFEGDPSNIDDLVAAQVLNAQRVVLLGGEGRDLDTSDASYHRFSSSSSSLKKGFSKRDYTGKIEDVKGGGEILVSSSFPTVTRERTESFHRPRTLSSGNFSLKDRTSSMDHTLLEIEENDALAKSRLQQETRSRSRRAHKYSNKQPTISTSLNGDRQVLIVAGILECLMSSEEYEKIHIITDLNMDFNANHLKHDCVVLDENEEFFDFLNENKENKSSRWNLRNRVSGDWENVIDHKPSTKEDENSHKLIKSEKIDNRELKLQTNKGTGTRTTKMLSAQNKEKKTEITGEKLIKNSSDPSLGVDITKNLRYGHNQTISTTSGDELRRRWLAHRQGEKGNTGGIGISGHFNHHRGRSTAWLSSVSSNDLTFHKHQSFHIESQRSFRNAILDGNQHTIGRNQSSRAFVVKEHQRALSHLQQDATRATGINSTYKTTMTKHRAGNLSMNKFSNHDTITRSLHPFYHYQRSVNNLDDVNTPSTAFNTTYTISNNNNNNNNNNTQNLNLTLDEDLQVLLGSSYRYNNYFYDNKFKPLTAHQGSISSDTIHYEELFDKPLVAAGRLCPQSLLDILLVRMFYNPMDLEFWKAILNIHHGNNFDHQFVATRLHPSMETGHIDQLSIPETMVGEPYMKLTQMFMEDDILCLGLYRRGGVGGAPMPFTELGPPEYTGLRSTDMVFVLMPPKRIKEKKSDALLRMFEAPHEESN